MSTLHAPRLRRRIRDVEARVAQRQQRLELTWREAQRSIRALVFSPRTLLLAMAGGALVVFAVLGRPKGAAKAGGALGILIAAGMAGFRRRYGSAYALAWRFLNRRRSARNATGP